MKKYLVNFLSTIVIALILSQLLPWWYVMVAAFISSVFFGLKRIAVFTIPFVAIALFWMVYAFYLSNSNDFILANKIATLLPLKGNPYLLILVTGIIGGIAAGIAAVLGKQCVVLIKKE